jgi:hypothetical protein
MYDIKQVRLSKPVQSDCQNQRHQLSALQNLLRL